MPNNNDYQPRQRVIVYLDKDRYSYLAWLAKAKRQRAANVALEMLEQAIDAQQRKTPAPR